MLCKRVLSLVMEQNTAESPGVLAEEKVCGSILRLELRARVTGPSASCVRSLTLTKHYIRGQMAFTTDNM
jgi:hypothetical protein